MSPPDLDYLCSNGYVLKSSNQDHETSVANVASLSQIIDQMHVARAQQEQSAASLQQDESKEHSFVFRLEGKEAKDELKERVQGETADVSREQSELSAMGTKVNELIQEKSMLDRMVAYNGAYLALTDLGKLVLNDLIVRSYRVADQEFGDFLAEIKATYAELRSIADTATYYVLTLRPEVPDLQDDSSDTGAAAQGQPGVEAPSLLWSTSLGLAKLRGDATQIEQRFVQALRVAEGLDPTVADSLMAAEVMTATSGQDIPGLGSALKNLNQQLRRDGVPKEESPGASAIVLAGRRYDGTFPVERFPQFKQLTSSSQAAAILSILNVPYDGLASKFQGFRSMFVSWGYTASEDVEVASAFLAIGELGAEEVAEKVKYVVEQLRNYLEYPLVAGAILSSIPVLESHEVLDLMEKAVTLLSGYARGLERSQLVALAVRMIHGVRNEIVKEIDTTAKITPTPIQFTYPWTPGFFFWYRPIIIVHGAHFSTFAGMGAFHPAHSHGVGGFAG